MVVDDRCPSLPARQSGDEGRLRERRSKDGVSRPNGARRTRAASSVADVVIKYARAVDLIVVAQRDSQWIGSVQLDVADRLAVEAGRPVLIVPNEGVHKGIGTRVVVAWNGRREATRAAFDALPFLQQAKDVKVLWVDQRSEGEPVGTLPPPTSARRWHATASRARRSSWPATAMSAAPLLSRAIEHRADLMVMGCYGHSRLSEFVFGGATRQHPEAHDHPGADVALAAHGRPWLNASPSSRATLIRQGTASATRSPTPTPPAPTAAALEVKRIEVAKLEFPLLRTQAEFRDRNAARLRSPRRRTRLSGPSIW